jgi:hypothetical protein
VKQIKGNKLIDYLLEQPAGTTLWFDNKQTNDLAVFDLFKWYSLEHKGNEIHIKEVVFN